MDASFSTFGTFVPGIRSVFCNRQALKRNETPSSGWRLMAHDVRVDTFE